MSAGSSPLKARGWHGLGSPAVAGAALVVAALAWSYAPNFLDLGRRWMDDPNYTHGFLVIPIALAILWQRRAELGRVRVAPTAWGWAALLGLLGLRALLYDRNEQWIEAATIPLVAAALVLAFGGWRAAWWALPGIAFLGLMLPLPPSVNALLAGPLQTLATWGSTALLQVLGLPVLAEGNVILVGADRLEVARACNGLSMLLSFVTLITATVLLSRSRPAWERVALLVSTVPIALVSNILRIAATAWAYHLLGAKAGERLAHDTAGWAMMPIALALCWLELKALSWLIVEDEPPPALFIPPAPAPPAAKKPKPPGAMGDE